MMSPTRLPTAQTPGRARPKQLGFTLIELMVAITVAIFLIGGLLTMVQSTRNAFGNQNLLAQLQDNERLVMTFMAEVVESAGYFPSPQSYTNVGVFPVTASGPFKSPAQPGQVVVGTYSAAAAGDTISIRYAAALGDKDIFNCLGLTNTAVGPYDVFVNTFSIDNTTDPTNPKLVCTVSSGVTPSTVVPLVNGVTNLAIFYGVQRNTVDTGSCVDTYVRADQMAPAAYPNDWLNVCSISLQITFVNPIISTKPIVIKRVIATMNAAGVNS